MPVNFPRLGSRVVPSYCYSNGVGFSGCDETFKKVIMYDCTLNVSVVEKHVLLSGSRVFGVGTFLVRFSDYDAWSSLSHHTHIQLPMPIVPFMCLWGC